MRVHSARSSSTVVFCRPVWTPNRTVMSATVDDRAVEAAFLTRGSGRGDDDGMPTDATTIKANGIELCYEEFGDPTRPAAAADHGARRADDRLGRRLLSGARPAGGSA